MNCRNIIKHERALTIGNMIGFLFNKIEKIYCLLGASIKCRRACNELHALTDAQLKDIGVHRGEIKARVMGLCDTK